MKIEFKSNRSNEYDLRVRDLIRQIKYGYDCAAAAFGDSGDITVSRFQNRFIQELKEMKPSGYVLPSFCYRAFLSEDGRSCEVWHIKKNHEKDRLIAIITN